MFDITRKFLCSLAIISLAFLMQACGSSSKSTPPVTIDPNDQPKVGDEDPGDVEDPIDPPPEDTINEALFVDGGNQGDWVMRLGAPSNWSGVDVEILTDTVTAIDGAEVEATLIDGISASTATQITWADAGQVYLQSSDSAGVDLSAFVEKDTALKFRLKVDEPPAGFVNLSAHCEWPCLGEVEISNSLRSLTLGEWYEASLPLSCLIERGLDATIVNTPFLIYSSNTLGLSIEEVEWETGAVVDTKHCGLQINNQLSEPLFVDGQNADSWVMRIGAPSNWAGIDVNLDDVVSSVIDGAEIEILAETELGRENARRAVWQDVGQIYVQTEDMAGIDLQYFRDMNASVQFDLKVNEAPAGDVTFAVHCEWPCLGDTSITHVLQEQTLEQWQTVKIPLACLDLDYTNVNTSFLIYTNNTMDISIDEVLWVPYSAPAEPDCTFGVMPDADGDGVDNDLDLCNSEPDAVVDINGCSDTGEGELFRMMTFNIRIDEANDPGERNWSERAEEVAQTILQRDPAILALQEASTAQREELTTLLGPNWVPSENGQFLYREDIFNVEEGGLIEVIEDVWGPRISEWGRFTRIDDERSVIIINNHWGVDSASQNGSAEIMKDYIQNLSQDGEDHIILAGDLNAEPGSQAINLMLDEPPLTNFLWEGTFNNWEDSASRQLDYIMVAGMLAKCWVDKYQEGEYPPSDHYPVYCDLQFHQ